MVYRLAVEERSQAVSIAEGHLHRFTNWKLFGMGLQAADRMSGRQSNAIDVEGPAKLSFLNDTSNPSSAGPVGQRAAMPELAGPAAARLEILRRLDLPAPGEERQRSLSTDLLTLIHSYAHRTLRQLAKHSGIERNGLGEYLLPHHLSFVLFANSRSDFVLGGLQAVFEQSLHRLLDDVIGAEHRCPLDPGCRAGGGACMACLHLGEPSCRWFNRYLDRSALFGPEGFVTGVLREHP